MFSLTAALLATLIRQRARDHMRIFQGYSPLKIARIRQYLFEGPLQEYSDYVPDLAEVVPGLVHISLLLFLAGLADFLLNTYTTVGRSTLFAVIFCPTLYIIITVAPVVTPQSSYRTPFSPLVWFITRRLDRWLVRYFARLTQMLMCPAQVWPMHRWLKRMWLSSNMARGQTQLAMGPSLARQRRDVWAILWLVDNLQNLESFVLVIPGSFDTLWGVEVWERFVDITRCYSDGRELSKKICRNVERLFEMCGDIGSFKGKDDWRMRSRAYTEAMALSVFFMGSDLTKIRNPGKLLHYIGDEEVTLEVSEIRSHQSFAIRWTCLSFVVIRKMLNSPQLQAHAEIALKKLIAFHPECNLGTTETARRNAQSIDEQFAAAWRLVESLRQVPNTPEEEDLPVTRERITEILRQNEAELIPIRVQVERMQELGMDSSLSEVQQWIDEVTHDLTRKLPGVAFDSYYFNPTLEHTLDLLANPVPPQFIYFSNLLRGLCGNYEEWSDRGDEDTVEALRHINTIPRSLSQSRLMERQLWRLDDLCHGALGFTLELYFLSIGKILSTFSSPPRQIHEIVLVKTFKTIASDWPAFTGANSIGTRQIIHNIVFDIAFRGRGIFSDVRYPDAITNVLLDLLGSMTIGQQDSYIEDARKEIHRSGLEPSILVDPQFLRRARGILGSPSPTPVLTSAPTSELAPAPAPAPTSALATTPTSVPAPTPAPTPEGLNVLNPPLHSPP